MAGILNTEKSLLLEHFVQFIHCTTYLLHFVEIDFILKRDIWQQPIKSFEDKKMFLFTAKRECDAMGLFTSFNLKTSRLSKTCWPPPYCLQKDGRQESHLHRKSVKASFRELTIITEYVEPLATKKIQLKSQSIQELGS